MALKNGRFFSSVFKEALTRMVSNHVPVSPPEPHAYERRPLALPSNPLPLFLSERKLLLAFFDLALLNAVFLGALSRRPDLPLAGIVAQQKWLWFAILSLVWLTCALLVGAYDLATAASVPRALAATTVAVAATWSVYLMIPYVTPTLPSARFDIVFFPLVGAVAVGAWRAAYATVFAQPRFEQRALVVGAGWAASTLARVIDERCREGGAGGIGYNVIGYIDDDDAKRDQPVEGRPVLGTRHDLVRLVRELRPQELVIAITHSETMHDELFEAIQECRELGVNVTAMAEAYEKLSGRVPIEHAGKRISVAVPLHQPPMHRFYAVWQRILDIVVGALGCALLVIIAPFVMLANRIASRGSLFYSQERVGKGGARFCIHKFRSMVADAEKHSGAVWASEDDPRITRVGKVLRKTRLDEMPQFWNILRGDMSLIGPRPERPDFTQQLTRKIPFYRVRHAVRPGLTGWAQVKYRYGASEEDSLTKLQYDLYYIKHQNVLLDLEIALKTLFVVFGFKGR